MQHRATNPPPRSGVLYGLTRFVKFVFRDTITCISFWILVLAVNELILGLSARVHPYPGAPSSSFAQCPEVGTPCKHPDDWKHHVAMDLLPKLWVVPTPTFKLVHQGVWRQVIGTGLVEKEHNNIRYWSFDIDESDASGFIKLETPAFIGRPVYMPKIYRHVKLLHNHTPVCIHSLHSDLCDPFDVPCPLFGIEMKKEHHAELLDKYNRCRGKPLTQ